MARVFITGSADGLGKLAGEQLIAAGHDVVLHARSAERAAETKAAVPRAQAVVIGDVSTLDAMKDVARQANELGTFDAVIHNVALGYREPSRNETADGLPELLAVNSLAPYVLTSLMIRPKRLVYLSSGLHRSGDPSLRDLTWQERRWNGMQAYSDSKLHNVLLAFAVARAWSDVQSNALEPGWVPTKMGGRGAPDDLTKGAQTQAWLAAGTDPKTRVTGQYFFHQQPAAVLDEARDRARQDAFVTACAKISGVALG